MTNLVLQELKSASIRLPQAPQSHLSMPIRQMRKSTSYFQEKAKLSAYLQDVCHKEYSALSKLFTEMRGISIEKYYLAQRIELVKELLAYDEMTVSEIADKLRYSSVAHLSAQFKAQTGLSPTQFKEMKEHRLRPLDEI